MRRLVIRLTLGIAALALGVALWASSAQCYGCAAVPCFRNGPPCMGDCSCQWHDDIHGVCG